MQGEVRLVDRPQRFIQCFYEKVVTPDNRLIYPQPFMDVIDAPFQNAFPQGIAVSQIQTAEITKNMDGR